MVLLKRYAGGGRMMMDEKKAAIRNGALFVGILVVFAFLLRDPALTAASALRGAELLLRAVLPSTFPYMVLAGLMLSGGMPPLQFRGKRSGFLRRFLWISEEGVGVVLLGLLAGFPVGAKIAAGLYADGRIGREEAERLSAYCNFCGPPFLIGAVGAGLPGGHRMGLLLWLLQSLLAILWGHFTGLRARRKGAPLPQGGRTGDQMRSSSFSLRFTGAVRGACEGFLLIAGFVLFFAVLTGILEAVLASLGAPELLRAIVCGALELSGGTAALSALPLGAGAKTFLLALFSLFSGASVLLQMSAFLLPTGLSPKKLLRARLLLAPVGAALLALFAL